MKMTYVYSCLFLMTIPLGCASTETDSVTEELIVSGPAYSKVGLPAAAAIEWDKFFTKESPKALKAAEKARNTHGIELGNKDNLALGNKAFKEKNFEAAERYYREHLEENPSAIMVKLKLATVLFKQKKTALLVEFLDEIRDELVGMDKVDKSWIHEYRMLVAMVANLAGQKDRAREVYQSILREDDTYAPAYLALATEYFYQGKWQRSKFIVVRGIDRCGETPEFLNLLGAISENDQDEWGPEHWYRQALLKDKTFHTASINLASLYLSRGMVETAKVEVAKVLEDEESNSRAQLLFAVILDREGSRQQAMGIIKRLLAKDPENLQVRFVLAELLAKSKESRQQAIQLFREVMELSPVKSALYLNSDKRLSLLGKSLSF